jgi:transposase
MVWCRAATLYTGVALTPPYSSAYSTIEGLFAIIESARSRNAARLNATYDPVRGFPTSISIDYIALAVDDEISYTIRDFHVR